MTKIKFKEIEHFYSTNRSRLIEEINKFIPSEEMADDVLHSCITNYIKEINKWGASEEINFEKILIDCSKFTKQSRLRLADNNNINVIVNDPLDVIVHNEEKERIVKFIFSLKNIYKTVLECYYLERMSVREIANKYNLKKDTVSKRIRRGKAKLLAKLKKNGFNL